MRHFDKNFLDVVSDLSLSHTLRKKSWNYFFFIVWEACLKSPCVAMPFWSGPLTPCREGPEYPFFKPEALFPFMMEDLKNQIDECDNENMNNSKFYSPLKDPMPLKRDCSFGSQNPSSAASKLSELDYSVPGVAQNFLSVLFNHRGWPC